MANNIQLSYKLRKENLKTKITETIIYRVTPMSLFDVTKLFFHELASFFVLGCNNFPSSHWRNSTWTAPATLFVNLKKNPTTIYLKTNHSNRILIYKITNFYLENILLKLF